MTPEQLTRRPLLYNNIDGTGELAMGFMGACIAFLEWMQLHAPKHSLWHSMPVFIVYWLAMSSVVHYGPRAIKQRLTYPRTGFVEYRKSTRWVPAIWAGLIAPVFTVGLALAIRSHWRLTTPVSLFGVLFAAVYAYRIATAARWKWTIAALLALGSIGIALLPPSQIARIGSGAWVVAFMLNFALWGVLLLTSGGITLWQYAAHTRPAETEEA